MLKKASTNVKMKKAVEKIDFEKVKSSLLKEHSCEWVDWDRNPPYASHAGGVWERQIRSIRSVLATLLHEFAGRLNDEALRTLMIEVESIVNSRPLTTEGLSDESIEPLTPSHLLTMKSKVVMPPGAWSFSTCRCVLQTQLANSSVPRQ